MKPGASFGFITSLGVTKGTWGFNNGEGYNARSERLDTIWKKYKKGILTVDAFWEGGVEFIRSKNNVFSLGIVYNPKNEFAIVTCPANTLVEPYHHRMPVMLADLRTHQGMWMYRLRGGGTDRPGLMADIA